MRSNLLLFVTIAFTLITQVVQSQCPIFDTAMPFTVVRDCGSATAKIVATLSNWKSSYTYSWTSPPGATTGIVNTPTFVTNTLGTYTISVTDPATLCTSSSTVEVIAGQLMAKITAHSFTNSPMTVHFINLSASSLGSGSITTNWNFGNGTGSLTGGASASPSVAYQTAGTYTVSIIAMKGDCSAAFGLLVFPGLPNQAWVGIKEELMMSDLGTIRYFDLNGVEQRMEKNKMLIEQVGERRRKVILFE